MDIIVRKYFVTILLTLLLSIFTSLNVQGQINLKASDIYLTPGGETIGIELSTSVVVVETYTLKNPSGTVDPAKTAGIKPGDIIINIDGKKINKIKDIRSELIKYKNGHNKPLNIIIKRDSKLLVKKMYPTRTKDNTISLGLYLRDNIMGIGTLTFIYNDKYFAALGHQIQDKDISIVDMYKADGLIRRAEVTSIQKSIRGNPGEKRAKFSKDRIGIINDNTTTGIYGIIDRKFLTNKSKMKIATQNEVKIGNAKILTVLDNNKVEAYDVKIIDLQKQNTKDIKGIKLKITDKKLLEKTGGIIQGMSGSPIIQNNKIVGAVTHVLVDDTTIGYGVYIVFMLEDMGINIVD